MDLQTYQSPKPSLLEEIIQRVAATKGVDPLDLPPIYYSIDATILERIYEPSSRAKSASLSVSFTYCDCRVTIRGDRSIEVQPAEEAVTENRP